ncbi:MAG: hypothetical protein HY400_04300, partial [Elusimicrobia bacterium]|nr:hypothetical protein [Elusimicrobiota bacterium]
MRKSAVFLCLFLLPALSHAQTDSSLQNFQSQIKQFHYTIPQSLLDLPHIPDLSPWENFKTEWNQWLALSTELRVPAGPPEGASVLESNQPQVDSSQHAAIEGM